jgi:hypothetical protein
MPATCTVAPSKTMSRNGVDGIGTHRKGPHLKNFERSKQLVVDGQAFLILGGELQNSSLTSAKYMREQWSKLKEANINTVLGCVPWEIVEPTEGQFDFTELDQIIQDARSHGLRLILLWFGAFKNGLRKCARCLTCRADSCVGQSTYAPAWVKTNSKRFPRSQLRKAGGVLETADVLSIFHDEAVKADARAFSALMTHLKQIDEQHSTVIMIQVENEVGLLGDSRDGCSAAEDCFTGLVPRELVEYLATNSQHLHPDLRKNLDNFQPDLESGNWVEVFGRSSRTDEIFMAYHYALFLERVAAAGRRGYDLPLYTNVWQNFSEEDADVGGPTVVGGGDEPGVYPSGGGVSGVLDIWLKFAPTLDFIAPDIYLNEYSSRCAKYRHLNQPLFIPEQRRDEYGARRSWHAIGTHQALGVAPFGVDTLTLDYNPYRKHFGLLASVQDIVLEAQRRPGSSLGFYFDERDESPNSRSTSHTAQFGEYGVCIERAFVFGKPGPGAGMIIHRSHSTFLLLGWGFQATFQSCSPRSIFTGILRMEEKEVVDGKLQTLRRLNGDETRSGKSCVMPNEAPDYGSFPVAITIPARTGISEVEVYSLLEEDGSRNE